MLLVLWDYFRNHGRGLLDHVCSLGSLKGGGRFPLLVLCGKKTLNVYSFIVRIPRFSLSLPLPPSPFLFLITNLVPLLFIYVYACIHNVHTYVCNGPSSKLKWKRMWRTYVLEIHLDGSITAWRQKIGWSVELSSTIVLYTVHVLLSQFHFMSHVTSSSVFLAADMHADIKVAIITGLPKTSRVIWGVWCTYIHIWDSGLFCEGSRYP